MSDTTANPYHYLCWLNCEDEESGVIVQGTDHADAAETYADQVNDDIMEEHSSPNWAGDYSVVVKHLYTGTVKRFNITREYEPMFSATEVR